MDRSDRRHRTAFERYLRSPGRTRLARVVDLFHECVWSMALRASGNEEDAHDIVQDVFLSLLLHPPLAGSIRSPRGYLAYRVLTFSLRSQRSRERRRRREARAARDVVGGCLVDVPTEDEEALREAITSLPERVRQAIQLRYFLGLKNEEVAGALAVSERTVEEDLREGRELLRKRLAPRVLGALALLSAESVPAATPAGLRGELLAIARSGSALALEGGVASATAMTKWMVAMTWLGAVLAGVGWLALSRGAPLETVGPPASLVLETVSPPSREEVARDGRSQLGETGSDVQPPDLIGASGWVVDDAGNPVAGARVGAYPSPSNLFSPEHLRRVELLAETETGVDGGFHVAFAVPSGFGVTLIAKKEGYATGWNRNMGNRGSLAGKLITLSSTAGSIEGRVLDSSENPIQEAAVWASVRTGSLGEVFWFDAAARQGFDVTDEEGRFAIGGLPAGSPVDIVVDHPDHLPVRLRHLVPGTADVEVRVERGSSFSGSVVDGEGRPVFGAMVSFGEEVLERHPVHHPVRRFHKTGHDGTFNLRGVPIGSGLLEVTPPDHYLPIEPRMLEMDSPVDGFRIVVHAESWIRGIARDRESGRGVEDASVVVRSKGILRRVSSARDGSFSCAVPPGEVEVLPLGRSTSYAGELGGGARGRVKPGETLAGLEVWFRPAKHHEPVGSVDIDGKVVDLQGTPAIALVGFSPAIEREGFGGTRREAVAGPDGAFRLEAVRLPGRLIACSPSKRLRAEIIVEEEGTVTMELEPYAPARIEGRVLAPSGESPDGVGVASAGILVSRTVEDKQAPVTCVLSEADGSFVIEDLLPDTPYLLNAHVGTVHGACSRVIPRPGMTIQSTIWLPARSAVLEGSIADSAGLPLAGIEVSWDFREDDALRFARASTDREGRFRIQDICPGEYQLVVDAPGFSVRGEEVSTRDSPIEIVLERTRKVLFELVDSAGLPHDRSQVLVFKAESSAEEPCPTAASTDGRFTVEVPLAASRIRIGRGQPPIELGGPSTQDIDLGRIVLDQP